MFIDKKDKNIFIFFVILIIIINFLSIINYYNGFFLSDEFIFIEYHQSGLNPFLTFNWQYYRPIPLFIFGFIYDAFLLNPIPYHLVSILMNSINTILFMVIAKKLFKNKLVPYIATLIFMIFYGFCFEIFLWIAVYFDIFFIFFTLCSVYFFINYYQSDKKQVVNFILAGIFLTLAFMSKETALFVLPIYLIFDILMDKDIKLFLKKCWKYLIYIPMAAIFLVGRLYSTSPTLYTIWNFLAMGALGVLLIPLILKIKDIDNKDLQFSYLLLYFSLFPLCVAPTSRIWYFTALGLSLIVSYFMCNSSRYSFFELIKNIRSINYTRNRKLILVLFISFISSSLTLYIFSNISYNWASKSTFNISNTISAANTTGKNVYLVNIPFNPLVWGMHINHLEASIRVIGNKSVQLKFIIINDNNKYLYDGNLMFGAELVSIAEYNNLTNNGSNLMYLYVDFPSYNIRNVTGLNYTDW